MFNEDYLKMVSINHLFCYPKYKRSLNIDKIFTCFNETIFEFILKKNYKSNSSTDYSVKEKMRYSFMISKESYWKFNNSPVFTCFPLSKR